MQTMNASQFWERMRESTHRRTDRHKHRLTFEKSGIIHRQLQGARSAASATLQPSLWHRGSTDHGARASERVSVAPPPQPRSAVEQRHSCTRQLQCRRRAPGALISPRWRKFADHQRLPPTALLPLARGKKRALFSAGLAFGANGNRSLPSSA